jgi:nitrogen regulatory protein PII
VVIVDQVEKFPELFNAWVEVGVPGATVVDSVGTHRIREQLSHDDIPLLPSLRSLLDREGVHNRLMFAVIGDDEVLERAIQAAERIIGDFMEPHTGIMFVVPVTRAFGVPSARKR